MKFETVLLHGLFGACLLACVLALTGMLRAQPMPAQVAAAPVASASPARG